MTALEILFHPIVTLIWHWGGGVAAIILLLAAAYFSPFAKKYFVYAAIAVAIFLVGYGVGIVDQKHLDLAQEKVINTRIEGAVTKSDTPAAKKSTDPWDKKDY